MEYPILLYLGTLFIAYEIVSKSDYLSALLIAIPMTVVAMKYIYRSRFFRTKQQDYRFIHIAKKVLYTVVVTIFVLVGLISQTIILILIIIGLLVKIPEYLLNRYYRFWLKRLPIEAVKPPLWLRNKMKMDELTDGEMWERLQNPVPFAGLIGVVLLTIGFILQLL